MKPKQKAEKPKVNADFEFLDRTSRRVEFLYDDPWRVFRIQSDLIQSVETMARSLEDSERVVAVFGSTESLSLTRTASRPARFVGNWGAKDLPSSPVAARESWRQRTAVRRRVAVSRSA